MSSESLRLFFALNMDRSARREIIRLQSHVWGEDMRGLTQPENLHLTLAFLGNTDPARLEELRQIMHRLEVPPLTLRFDRIGVFRRENGDIWWLGMGENRELQRLQMQLIKELGKAAFPVENRKFVPHLTLARRANPRKQPKDGKLERPIFAKVNTVSLMRSHHLDGKLVYTELMNTRES